MTKAEALDALIDAVEAGTIAPSDLDAFIPSLGLSSQANDAHSAYRGDLNAAKALHEALLPGVSQYSVVTDPTCIRANAVWWPDGLAAGRECHGEGWSEDNEARARLLAILKAYRASL